MNERYKLQIYSEVTKDWTTIGIFYAENIDVELVNIRKKFPELTFRKELYV